eukprot:71900-Amphidinium_carterae.1
MARDVLSSLAVPGGKYVGGQQDCHALKARDLSRASSRFDSTVSTEARLAQCGNMRMAADLLRILTSGS